MRKTFVTAILCFASGGALAATMGYDVVFRNLSDLPVIVQIKQYHSPAFNDGRPATFTGELRLRTRSIIIAPKQPRSLHFNNANGGYWIQWEKVDPLFPAASGTLDLVRDKRSVDIP